MGEGRTSAARVDDATFNGDDEKCGSSGGWVRASLRDKHSLPRPSVAIVPALDHDAPRSSSEPSFDAAAVSAAALRRRHLRPQMRDAVQPSQARKSLPTEPARRAATAANTANTVTVRPSSSALSHVHRRRSLAGLAL